MTLAQILQAGLLGVVLALDAFTVSVTCGLARPLLRFRQALRPALIYGAFQAGMPLLGSAAGSLFARWLHQLDHWLAFALLALVGLHMIHQARHPDRGLAPTDPLATTVLLSLGLATSIDALAVGFTLPALGLPGLPTALIIGGVTFFISMVGLRLGKELGDRPAVVGETLGGVVLIGLGLKILVEHLLRVA